jgi:hypothetical protein
MWRMILVSLVDWICFIIYSGGWHQFRIFRQAYCDILWCIKCLFFGLCVPKIACLSVDWWGIWSFDQSLIHLYYGGLMGFDGGSLLIRWYFKVMVIIQASSFVDILTNWSFVILVGNLNSETKGFMSVGVLLPLRVDKHVKCVGFATFAFTCHLSSCYCKMIMLLIKDHSWWTHAETTRTHLLVA